MKNLFYIIFLMAWMNGNTQPVSVNPDMGAHYRNPVIHADYSDPDAIRVGDDYYMVSSSFNSVPGLPILHSKDLVNWKLMGYALKELVPKEHFQTVQHGGGVWAPSIRYHKNEFYIYYPDPDFGIYLVKAKNIRGPWSAPQLVAAGKGLIDPCPLWDDDGKAYLVHAYAGSRAGIKSILVVCEMNIAGTALVGDPVLIYDGHVNDPTVEGPKIYKRDKFYYVFAPAGGVSTGWQIVLRSKNIYGPYERKVVMHQGETAINGPHQGAWVTTRAGADWFLHFQDKEAYGRVVHLQPMQWKDGWPIIGIESVGDNFGEPVTEYRKPLPGKGRPFKRIIENFDQRALSADLQWQANPGQGWSFHDSRNKSLRLYAMPRVEEHSLWMQPNMLLHKFPATSFHAYVDLKLNAINDGEEYSLIVMGMDYARLAIAKRDGAWNFVYASCRQADKETKEETVVIDTVSSIHLRLHLWVREGALCEFGYQENEGPLEKLDQKFSAKPGKWVGAKFGMVATRKYKTNDAGWVQWDNLVIEFE